MLEILPGAKTLKRTPELQKAYITTGFEFDPFDLKSFVAKELRERSKQS